MVIVVPDKTQTRQYLYTVTFWKVDPDAGSEYAKRTGTIIETSVLQDDIFASSAAEAKRLATAKYSNQRELSMTSYDSVSARRIGRVSANYSRLA